MGGFDRPAALSVCSGTAKPSLGFFLLADAWSVAAFQRRPLSRPAGIARIGAQQLPTARVRFRTCDHNRIEDPIHLAQVMPIGSGDDEGQRDSMGVHQDVALGAFFSPDPWDWVPRPPAPGEP